jgi:pimeloyl-ACP methyl ester carboxylesterase
MEAFRLESPPAYLRYLDLPGQDAPIVFLHGLGCASSADFPHLVIEPELNGHRFLLVDLLGHGYSDRPMDFDYTLESHAATVAKLLDHLSLKQCIVFGHSMGGSIAVTMTAERPDLVSRLILAEANLDPGGGFVSKVAAGQTEDEFIRGGHAALAQRIESLGFITSAGDFLACSPHGLYRSAVSLVRGTQPTMRQRLNGFPIPRTFLFSERSLPDPGMERLKRDGIQVLVVPNAGHPMMVDNPAGTATAISQALAIRVPS